MEVQHYATRLQKLCKLKFLSKITIILFNAICSVSFVSNTINLQDTHNYSCCTWSWKDDACEIIFDLLDIKRSWLRLESWVFWMARWYFYIEVFWYAFKFWRKFLLHIFKSHMSDGIIAWKIGQPISTCSAPYIYLIRSRVAQNAKGFLMIDTFR